MTITIKIIHQSVVGNGLVLDNMTLTDEDTQIICLFLKDNPEITSLRLRNIHLGVEGVKALATNPTLTSLFWRDSKLSAEIAKVLAGNTTLTELDVCDNEIGLEGVKALAANTTLRSLNVGNNHLDLECVKALAANTTLTSLNVYDNQIGEEGVKALAANTTLRSLNVSYNLIDDEGVKALAANTTLTELDVSDNDFGDEGAKALAANTTLTELDVSDNDIGDKGAKALAANTTLTSLDVSYNHINDKDVEQVLSNNYVLIQFMGIETDGIKSILYRNAIIRGIQSSIINVHLTQEYSDYETILNAIDTIKTQVPHWEILSENHYISEVIRLLTGLAFQKTEAKEQELENKLHALEQLLPDFTNSKLNRIANLRLSELLLINFDELQLNQDALLLSLNGLRHDIEEEAFHKFAIHALFKLMHPTTQFTFMERASFNEKTVLLSHNQWQAIVNSVLNTLIQQPDSSQDEINLLSSLLQPNCYDLRLACESIHLVEALRESYPKCESFTTPEHCLLMAQIDKDKMLTPLTYRSVHNSEIKPIVNVDVALDELIFNLKEALYQRFFGDPEASDKDSVKSGPIIKQTLNQELASVSMMVLGGFIAAAGIAAVAIAFTLLNAATFGIPGLVVVGVGIAATLAGVGLFATGAYQSRDNNSANESLPLLSVHDLGTKD